MPEESLSDQIRASEKTRIPVETRLTTDQRVLARITDGIYRQPSSALRELISNAYDADATEVLILTDAPRFSEISVRDDGLGLSPEVLEHMVRHIGGSAKRSDEGKELGVTAAKDATLSPKGRQLIGKLGIGLFSVAQFTRHFLIITKQKYDTYRTVADITLGSVHSEKKRSKQSDVRGQDFETGHAKLWREPASDRESQGTEIKLLDLLPRTKAELASQDLWTRVALSDPDEDAAPARAPLWHIGSIKPKQSDLLDHQPRLPWTDLDDPAARFRKLVGAVRTAGEVGSESVDLDIIFDRYLQTIWTLSLCVPLPYVDTHPFDLTPDDDVDFFELENQSRGQASRLQVGLGETPRRELGLKTPNGTTTAKDAFDVYFDGLQLFRPILYKHLPKTSAAVRTPLLFIGHDTQRFGNRSSYLSGGTLAFEAYLFWAPKIVPKQHQGVMLRVGNASGALFDKTFMGYQVSEQTRTRQIIAEIFVREGLDDAINLDRESFNYAHPHYQYLVKWLHSALRQLANRHKDIGKHTRSEKLAKEGKRTREKVEERVEMALKERGIEDVPDVTLVEPSKQAEIKGLRKQGTIALRKNEVVPPSTAKLTSAEEQRRKLAEKKAVAITQLLHGWGLLGELSFEDQEKLIRAILEIVLVDQ